MALKIISIGNSESPMSGYKEHIAKVFGSNFSLEDLMSRDEHQIAL
jgi:hypothetical protein